MIKGSVSTIESFGLVDGPGIRAIVFLNHCRLRCKYCHNPEMWLMQEANTTASELVNKLTRYKPYFKRNNGGVTFSGGDPIMQVDFLIECLRLLKEEGIHTALDTAGSGAGRYEEILALTDLIIYDIKHVAPEEYKKLCGQDIEESHKFIDIANQMEKKFWLRQVIIPGLTDSAEYLLKLKEYLKKFKNVEKIEFLAYHKMGDVKYEKLGITNPYKDMPAMDVDKTKELEAKFLEMIK